MTRIREITREARRMEETAAILWHNPFDGSTELCRLMQSSGGFVIEGLVLVPVDDRPGRVDYRVETDRSWSTRRVIMRLESAAASKEITLERDDRSRWTLDGRPERQLEGCVDVDLRVTPSTNTLPIRRLAPVVGDSVEVRAAWVGFPQLEVRASQQSYERTGPGEFIYRSGDFEADLEVDDVGLVVRYGDRFWSTLARRKQQQERTRRAP